MARDDVDTKGLGPWSNDDLETTARENAGVGADSDLPDEARFVAGVAKLVRRRGAHAEASEDPKRLAIFLMKPTPPGDVSSDLKRVPMLDNGLTVVTGRLWFVTPTVVTGKYLDLEEQDDDSLFRRVTDVLQLGDCPAAVFDPRPGIAELRFYPAGLDKPEEYQSTTFRGNSISVKDILEAVDRLHRECLVTPDAQAKAGKLWEDSARCWPSSSAEDIIQLYLRTGLTMAFPTCTVRPEQPGVPGRLDLEVEESAPQDRGVVIRHAILELKVLRSFRRSGRSVSDEETRDWIESGVTQAAAYCADRNASAAALCCFDMRRENTGEQCFDHVRGLAERLTVSLRRWFLYATAEQYRAAQAVQA